MAHSFELLMVSSSPPQGHILHAVVRAPQWSWGFGDVCSEAICFSPTSSAFNRVVRGAIPHSVFLFLLVLSLVQFAGWPPLT